MTTCKTAQVDGVKFGDVLGEVFGFIAKIIGGVIDGINWLSQSWVGRIVNSTMAGAATGFAVAGLPGAVVGGTVGTGYGIGTEAADYMSTRHGIVAAPHPMNIKTYRTFNNHLLH